ncbi:hypothetical protein GDO86_005106 [Hymenochirus boettgeri]|uniref:Sm domain-containing protein n=1 Tax=Hymenochirus boettgeri TaxID=247094 RepID=A0A8T2J4U8_9PIPI|nr:hypothetical protein GDO86_005106 [Hymenochirus boettgeri]
MAEGDPGSPGDRLDVSSDSFDPLLALYSPRTPLPFPDVRCFNNLAEYESFLRGRATRGRSRGNPQKKATKKGQKPAPDPDRAERLRRMMVPETEDKKVTRPRRDRTPRNVLTRMEVLAGSPLGELNRCVQERIRIQVHIRTFKGLRGVCSGFILAFDKFWNMLFDKLKLQESGETESEPQEAPSTKKPSVAILSTHGKKVKEISTSHGPSNVSNRTKGEVEEIGKEGTDDRPKKKGKVDYQQVLTRHMKQVFIRGENVLLVHIPD